MNSKQCRRPEQHNGTISLAKIPTVNRRNFFVVTLFMLGLLSWVPLQSRKLLLPGCNVVWVWFSHRGHLDSGNVDGNWTCEYVLNNLSRNNIRNFDVDLILHKNEILVAHPQEMTAAAVPGTITSPCSGISLKNFVRSLSDAFGEDGFYVTMEPKSGWKEEADFLAPPEQVVGSILDVLEQHPIQGHNCALILEPWQATDSRVTPLLQRVKQHCQLARSFKRNVESLNVKDLPSAQDYAILMPTIELFGGPEGDEFLQKSSDRNMKNIVWVIDSMDALRKALALKGAHGAITNHPVKLKGMYEEICHTHGLKVAR